MPTDQIFKKVLSQHFPGAITEAKFVDLTYRAASQFGFNQMNTLACIGVCRDELTSSFVQSVQKVWGQAFNFSSLAGMLFLGKTGFDAAHQHAPITDGRERYVYYAFPHIAISSKGAIGKCNRRGLKNESPACGALAAFEAELGNGKLRLELDFDDLEQSLLKRKLSDKILPGMKPDILGLTHIAAEVILADLENMISLTVDTKKSDYAVITGIQIHGPNNNYIAPILMYACENNQKREFVI